MRFQLKGISIDFAPVEVVQNPLSVLKTAMVVLAVVSQNDLLVSGVWSHLPARCLGNSFW